jgi:hypothetical protein
MSPERLGEIDFATLLLFFPTLFLQPFFLEMTVNVGF